MDYPIGGVGISDYVKRLGSYSVCNRVLKNQHTKYFKIFSLLVSSTYYFIFILLERQRGRDRSSSCCFILQMHALARAGLGQSQELGPQSRSPT